MIQIPVTAIALIFLVTIGITYFVTVKAFTAYIFKELYKFLEKDWTKEESEQFCKDFGDYILSKSKTSSKNEH